MPKPLSRLKAFVLDLLFPLECLGCAREKTWLCSDCLRRLKFLGADKIHNLKTPALDKLFIAGDYDDALLADLIIKFKYHFIRPLGELLADFLSLYWSDRLASPYFNYQTNPKNLSDNNLLVIPVPLSRKRTRWRGFNQAEILAREFSLHFSYSLSLNLKRIKHCLPQATLNENKRLKNVTGAFVYSGPNLTGRTIIIIDDVVTTGATLNEAAVALRAHGATNIYGLVLAKG